jgi:hypothetical protein
VYTTTEVAQGELGGPQLRSYPIICLDAAPMLLDRVLLGTAAASATDESAAA